MLLKEDSRDQLLYESCSPYSLEAFLMLLNYLVNGMFAVLLVKSPVCVYSSSLTVIGQSNKKSCDGLWCLNGEEKQ